MQQMRMEMAQQFRAQAALEPTPPPVQKTTRRLMFDVIEVEGGDDASEDLPSQRNRVNRKLDSMVLMARGVQAEEMEQASESTSKTLGDIEVGCGHHAERAHLRGALLDCISPLIPVIQQARPPSYGTWLQACRQSSNLLPPYWLLAYPVVTSPTLLASCLPCCDFSCSPPPSNI